MSNAHDIRPTTGDGWALAKLGVVVEAAGGLIAAIGALLVLWGVFLISAHLIVARHADRLRQQSAAAGEEAADAGREEGGQS